MRPILLSLVLLLALPGSRPVHARPTGKAAARKHFNQGRSLFAKRQYAAAIVAYKKAYQVWKHRVILYNIALCHAFLGQTIPAAIQLREYLKSSQGTEKLPVVLKRVQQQTGEIQVQTPDPKVGIYLDGHLKGYGNIDVVVLIGRRAVEIRRGDRILARKVLVVTPQKEVNWVVTELPRPRPRPKPRPRLRPKPRPRPQPVLPPKPPPPPPRPKGLHWGIMTAVAGVAVASLAAGIALHLRTDQLRDEYIAGGNVDADLRSQGIRMYYAANVMWGAAAVTAASAAVLAFFTRWRSPRAERARVSIIPLLGNDHWGLSLRFSP